MMTPSGVVFAEHVYATGSRPTFTKAWLALPKSATDKVSQRVALQLDGMVQLESAALPCRVPLRHPMLTRPTCRHGIAGDTAFYRDVAKLVADN